MKVKGPKKLLKVKTGPTVQETPTSRSRRSARGVQARPDLLLREPVLEKPRLVVKFNIRYISSRRNPLHT